MWNNPQEVLEQDLESRESTLQELLIANEIANSGTACCIQTVQEYDTSDSIIFAAGSNYAVKLISGLFCVYMPDDLEGFTVEEQQQAILEDETAYTSQHEAVEFLQYFSYADSLCSALGEVN